MTQTVNEILTPAGRKWLAKFKLNEQELRQFCRNVNGEGPWEVVGVEAGLSYQCGACEVETEPVESLPVLLAKMVSCFPTREGNEGSSLFIATWNNHQKDNTAIFRKAGFSKPTRWTTNPNSGNKIRGSMCVLNPKYRKQKKEDRSDWW